MSNFRESIFQERDRLYISQTSQIRHKGHVFAPEGVMRAGIEETTWLRPDVLHLLPNIKPLADRSQLERDIVS